jgi:hypothetical protein
LSRGEAIDVFGSRGSREEESKRNVSPVMADDTYFGKGESDGDRSVVGAGTYPWKMLGRIVLTLRPGRRVLALPARKPKEHVFVSLPYDAQSH